ncbi:neuritin-like protein isoform X1 [Paramormyrops kingsleyae]|uniref:Neuritin 1 like n=2 Tax=Paramormyrops kingsleyae TaxID=1676925 RepID=A0A3B3RCS5_9TELE|nr:neuritin-like protein [Paramormyrops kingsleyae]
MRPHANCAVLLMPVALQLMLVPLASTRKCGSIYKGFAQCLLALGDSMADSVQKDEGTQEIDTVCRSWDEFHVCANAALEGCPDEAAAVWESLRQESRKMQFSGNLYDMCSTRAQAPPSPLSPPDQGESNQESLKATAIPLAPSHFLLLPVGLLLHRI